MVRVELVFSVLVADISFGYIGLFANKAMSVIAEGKGRHAREHRIGTFVSSSREMLTEVHIERKISCMFETEV